MEINFKLISNHKALENYKQKIDFGSARIQRWFERFSRFDFECEYRAPKDTVVSDALSRSINFLEKNLNERKILDWHIKFNHRKDLVDKLRKNNISISKNNLRKILNKCKKCLIYDKKNYKNSKHILSSYSGEKVAFDILEINKNA